MNLTVRSEMTTIHAFVQALNVDGVMIRKVESDVDEGQELGVVLNGLVNWKAEGM